MVRRCLGSQAPQRSASVALSPDTGANLHPACVPGQTQHARSAQRTWRTCPKLQIHSRVIMERLRETIGCRGRTCTRIFHFASCPSPETAQVDWCQVHNPCALVDINVCSSDTSNIFGGAVQPLRISDVRLSRFLDWRLFATGNLIFRLLLDEGEGWWGVRNSMGSPSALRRKELPTKSRVKPCTFFNRLQSLVLGLHATQDGQECHKQSS